MVIPATGHPERNEVQARASTIKSNSYATERVIPEAASRPHARDPGASPSKAGEVRLEPPCPLGEPEANHRAPQDVAGVVSPEVDS